MLTESDENQVLGDKQPGAPPSPSLRSTRWSRWGRWVALVVVCLVGGWGLAATPNGYRIVDDFLSAWLGGALAVAVLIHLLGLGRYEFRKRRRGPTTYRAMTYSPLIITTALVLSVLAGAGHYAQEHSKATQSAVKSSGLGNARKLSTAQNAFIAFQHALVACSNGSGYIAARTRLAQDEKAHKVSALGGDFSRGLAEAQPLGKCISHLPVGTPGLVPIVARFTRAGSLLVAGWSLYNRGWGPPQRQSLLDRGDAVIRQENSELKDADSAGNALYRRLGGAALLGDRLAVRKG
jgi:hypothetical protein